jgi:hypothetical protein
MNGNVEVQPLHDDVMKLLEEREGAEKKEATTVGAVSPIA